MPVTIRQALSAGAESLSVQGIETPGLDASLLLAFVLNKNRSSLIAAAADSITEESLEAFHRLIERRLAGECVAYITGKKEFYGLEFHVNPSVLVPRPETETLVEAALRLTGGSDTPIRVLDLCTGSGAAAIALKHTIPELEVWATDISGEALETAKTNAARLLSPNSITFLQGNLYDAFQPSMMPPYPFSIIVNNPPYIPSAELSMLPAEVQKEPVIALNGGSEGLDIIKKIIFRAPEFLSSGGFLLLEADPRQMNKISALLKEAGFSDIQTHNDLSGRERVIEGRKKQYRGSNP